MGFTIARMFVATTLLYPCVLALLCLGAGLAVDATAGRVLGPALLPAVGAAALVGLSQLSTYVSWLAPATPYLMLALALAGFAACWAKAVELAAGWLRRPGLVAVSVLAYALALAPVLAGARPSFSSYMALADSAVHMLGADFLIHHGQEYAQLDLSNSYGQFVHDYYGSAYPSGADTLFGGSALLLGLPLIWSFQPFNAFMLALAVGPVSRLARAVGLTRAWLGVAVLTIVLPALVYAYELLASVKEVTALVMLLALGALVIAHDDWLDGRRARGALPFALVLAAGLSALGVAFAAWALAPVAVLALVLGVRAREGRAAGRLTLVGVGALALGVAALPTWANVAQALRVASAIASTSNAGNLHAPLRVIQVVGVWLRGSYKLAPTGAALLATHVLIWLGLAAAVLGVVQLVRIRAWALAGWLALMLLASLVVSRSVTTWGEAKTLVLSSPIALLVVWAGIAALLAARGRAARLARAAGVIVALALSGGVLVSDALLYHSSNLAPSARYDELASLNSRFAGRGPTLFADFDEYALYELRSLDVGGPNFAYPPAALASAAGGYGRPTDLDRIAPRALLAYPLIVTRVDPAASRPPSAYRLLWQGSYYQVWSRTAGAPAASAHVALAGPPGAQCRLIGVLAAHARTSAEQLVGAQAPELIGVDLARASRPRGWGRERSGVVMSSAGRLSTSFSLPQGGNWEVWVQGQIMPTVTLYVDGRRVGSISGQLDGNSLVPDTVPPFRVRLATGAHRLTLVRSGFSLAPGAGGSAVLDAVFLTPADTDPRGPLRSAAASDWQSLCGRRYEWVELVPSVGART